MQVQVSDASTLNRITVAGTKKNFKLTTSTLQTRMWWYKFLNYFFFCFHTTLIFFNTFGWIFRKTRKWNLITLLLTAFSWFILGIWYGWGYCFCTDWHWSVRKHLGYVDKSNSYIHFLALKLTGIDFSASIVDTVTAIVFFTSLVFSIWLNVRDWKKT